MSKSYLVQTACSREGNYPTVFLKEDNFYWQHFRRRQFLLTVFSFWSNRSDSAVSFLARTAATWSAPGCSRVTWLDVTAGSDLDTGVKVIESYNSWICRITVSSCCVTGVGGGMGSTGRMLQHILSLLRIIFFIIFYEQKFDFNKTECT